MGYDAPLLLYPHGVEQAFMPGIYACGNSR